MSEPLIDILDQRWRMEGFPAWVETRVEPKRPVVIRNVENIIKVGDPDE